MSSAVLVGALQNETIQQNTISSKMNYWLQDFWTEVGDPRVADYPFMSSPRAVLSVVALYLTFVLYIGPRYMKNRKPYSLKPLLIVYNLAMSLINAFFVYQILVMSDPKVDLFDVKFRPVTDRSPLAMYSTRMSYLYMLTKFIDLFDTVFFVLRKKQNQVTGLHLYHHSMVATMSWVYFRMNGAFIVTTYHFAFWNTFIHVLMYAYYGLSALGPAMQPYLWWKRYLTQLQIVQFVSIFFHGLYFCLYQEGYHYFFQIDIMIQAVLYLYMFGSFYARTYNTKPKDSNKSKPELQVDSKKIE